MNGFPTLRLGFRTVALLPVVLFIPIVVSFVTTEPGTIWPEYIGVFFHLAVLPLIARMPAPEWARAAGYGWITIDVLTGITAINAVPYDITGPTRLGGHVLAGTWILVSALHARAVPARVLGAVTGVWLSGFSFVAHVVPGPVLYPAALLIVVWFALLAATQRTTDDDRAFQHTRAGSGAS